MASARYRSSARVHELRTSRRRRRRRRRRRCDNNKTRRINFYGRVHATIPIRDGLSKRPRAPR